MRIDKLLLGLFILVFLVLYTAAIMSFLQTQGESRTTYLAIIGLPLGAILFIFPRAALLVLGVLVYCIDWLSDVWALIPREATWLIDILILMLLMRTALFSFKRTEPMPGIEKYFYFLLAFALISAALNGMPQLTIFVGVRVAFRYLGLFVVAYYLDATREWFRTYLKYIFVIGLVQTPIVIAQFLYYGWGDPDKLCGTFGAGQTPAIGIFLITLVCWIAARVLEEHKVHTWQLALFAWISVVPLLGEVKFYFMFMPLLAMFVIRREFAKRPIMSLGIAAAGVLLLVAVDFVVTTTGGWAEGRNPLTYIRRLPEVFGREMDDPTETRFERTFQYSYAVRLAADSPQSVLIGNGPGSITQSILSAEHSPKSAFFSRFGLSSNSTTIIWMLIEYGYVGTFLFALSLVFIYRRGAVLRRCDDMELRVMGRALENMTFVFGAWMFYTSAWQIDTMNFMYWPTAAMIIHFSYVEERRIRALHKAETETRDQLQIRRVQPVRAPIGPP